jgi:hypothetical protein
MKTSMSYPRDTQLRLVTTATLERSRIDQLAQAMHDEGHSADEVASVHTFIFGGMRESHSIADNRGPWDEFTGGDAA